MKNIFLAAAWLTVVLTAELCLPQRNEPTLELTQEIARLKPFGGDWTTSERMERSEFFPNGGSREGTAQFRLGTGGGTVIAEGHSDGSAGKLYFLYVIWWDKKAGVYRFFTCFKDTG